MSGQDNFGYLGYNFQIKLLNNILIDKNFGKNIVEHINPKYFDNQYFKFIMQMIKEYYNKYSTIPSFEALEQVTLLEQSSDMAAKNIGDMLIEIKNIPMEDNAFVQEKSLKFCKQQELKKAIKKVNSIMEKGEFESYDLCEEYIRKATQIGEQDNSNIEVFENANDVMEKDFRHPIPTGINGIDNLLNGGLAKGELGLILAPSGIGKTTALTKIANYAYNVGLNVLQIIFEDNPKVIQRKHYTIWSKIPQNKLSDNRDLVLAKVEEYKNRGGKLIIKKLPSDSLNIIQIKNQIRKMISEGFKPDIVVLDYIDCVLPVANSSASEWKNEGSIIRQFEAMSSELDFAGWVGVQGNRDSMSSDVVTSDQMGGSIKKAQVGHVIITIAKSLQQKELGLATMALVKSRIGKDGVVFENCIFNNDTMEISTDQSTTLLGYEKDAEEAEEEERNKRVKQLMDNK